ncbi:hypothetical protein ACQY0O_007614 [Thecaphora frezii]
MTEPVPVPTIKPEPGPSSIKLEPATFIKPEPSLARLGSVAPSASAACKMRHSSVSRSSLAPSIRARARPTTPRAKTPLLARANAKMLAMAKSRAVTPGRSFRAPSINPSTSTRRRQTSVLRGTTPVRAPSVGRGRGLTTAAAARTPVFIDLVDRETPHGTRSVTPVVSFDTSTSHGHRTSDTDRHPPADTVAVETGSSAAAAVLALHDPPAPSSSSTTTRDARRIDAQRRSPNLVASTPCPPLRDRVASSPLYRPQPLLQPQPHRPIHTETIVLSSPSPSPSNVSEIDLSSPPPPPQPRRDRAHRQERDAIPFTISLVVSGSGVDWSQRETLHVQPSRYDDANEKVRRAAERAWRSFAKL